MIQTPSTSPVQTPIETAAEAGHLWPMPTLTLHFKNAEDFNARLARIVLDEERKILGKSSPTEVAGITEGLSAYWLNFNVLNWNYPEILEFRRIVLAGIREWVTLIGDPNNPEFQVAGISCWANVLRYGERLTIHHHDPAFLSAHYTVQSGYEDGSPLGAVDAGYTVYFRPGFAERSHGGDASMAASPWDDDWRLEKAPVPGRLMFFPSFVRHEVRPYLGKTYRISIAMDVFFKRQKLPIHFGGPRWFVPK
jgi:putative 2-oxoglutarate-Fe(II)-dependent oxygenase superfamily protein